MRISLLVLALTLPLAVGRPVALHEPIWLILVAVALGTTATSFYLAFGPPDYWDHLGEGDFEAETPKTVTDPARLPPRVDVARAQGWTIVPEEAVIGVNAIAARLILRENVSISWRTSKPFRLK